MSEAADYRAWWEKCSDQEFLVQFAANPHVVLRQIGVALDMLQAPIGSDQEIFPTLSPTEALEILHNQRGG